MEIYVERLFQNGGDAARGGKTDYNIEALKETPEKLFCLMPKRHRAQSYGRVLRTHWGLSLPGDLLVATGIRGPIAFLLSYYCWLHICLSEQVSSYRGRKPPVHCCLFPACWGGLTSRQERAMATAAKRMRCVLARPLTNCAPFLFVLVPSKQLLGGNETCQRSLRTLDCLSIWALQMFPNTNQIKWQSHWWRRTPGEGTHKVFTQCNCGVRAAWSQDLYPNITLSHIIDWKANPTEKSKHAEYYHQRLFRKIGSYWRHGGCNHCLP